MPFNTAKDIISVLWIKTFELKHKKLPIWLGILIIPGIVVGIILLTFIMYVLKELTGLGFFYILEFLILIVTAVWLARTRLIEFTYYLSGDILRIDRIYSRRPKLDLFIRMDQVLFMGRIENLPEQYRKYRRQRETFKSFSANSFCVVHLVENKYFTAILSPSEEFETALVNAWKEKTHKSKK